jgi:hypothetical protein
MFGSKTFTMPNGEQRILYRKQVHKAYQDAIHHIDSAEARIVLNAVDDDNGNGGKMLQLLRAIIN